MVNLLDWVGNMRNSDAVIERPEPDEGPTGDERAVDRAPAARVGAFGPVVAQHEIFVVIKFDAHLAEGLLARLKIRLRQYLPFGVYFVVNDDLIVLYLQGLAGQADDPFYEKLRLVQGIAEDDHIPPPRVVELIRQLVNEDVVAVLKG